MEDNFWDMVSLSRYLGIKRSTLYAMVERGEIPYYRIGRLVRFKPCEIDEWLRTKKFEHEEHPQRRAREKPRSPSDLPANLVRAAIDELNPDRYNRSGKSDRIRGLRKEG
jgi:excisionase family DNA binding protein